MLVCIPTLGNAGVDDRMSDHFGSAPFFTLYDSSSEQITVLPNQNLHHGHGMCHPMNQLATHKVESVVCGGMGYRAIEALTSAGVKVYQTPSISVKDVIEKIKNDSLKLVDPANACGGHGHGGGCAHGGFGEGQGHDGR
jgi:predicted Fe-Mo cluster-binding NifX family protein